MRLPASIRWYVPLTCAVFFLLIGLAFIPQAGIQNDEALFGSGIYEKVGIAYTIELPRKRIALMLISYLGALKSWIYGPIFKIWRPSATSIRVPVLLAGALTIWLFWRLLRRIAGDRAAAVGAILLAADSLFLLTTCFDWGPVALQHLLLVSGVLCLARFHQEQKIQSLALGFFFFGLGLWDKAVFIWMLSGMVISTAVLFHQELRKAFSLRNLAVAAIGFAIGAAPLIYYNSVEPLTTFRSNAHWDASNVPGKAILLVHTLSGQALFGYINNDKPDGHAAVPATSIERISLWLSDVSGGPQNGLMGYALLGALLLVPWLWSTPARRPILFALVSMAVAWVQMLFGHNIGGGVHHTILLWPFPTLIVAVAFAEASRKAGRIGKPLLAATVLILAGASALVTNEYHAELVRNGATVTWSNAINPLSDLLMRVKPRFVFIDDWGMFDNLRLLNRGRRPLQVGIDSSALTQLDPQEKSAILVRMAEPDSVFVTHPDGAEQFAGINSKLLEVASEGGYRQEMLARIPDRNQRVIFEVFRFAKALPGRE